jgi:hypothetical protein
VGGSSCQFAANWTDETGLSGYIFGTNNTGSWVNQTWTVLGSNPAWANVTETLNETGGFVISYRWWANDTSNNWGDSGIQNLTTTDHTDPTVNHIAASSVIAGASCQFSGNWTDETGLSGYIFSTNNTGTWTNETWAAFSTNPSWANATKTLNITGGLVIGYRWFANDTSNNWGDSGIQSLTTTDHTNPTVSEISASSVIGSSSCELAANWTDETGLSGYIFSTNNTGSWVNETWNAFSTNPSWANVTKTLNATGGLVIGYRWFANDTSDNWGDSGIQTLTTTDLTVPTVNHVAASPVIAGAACHLSANWTDETGLSGYIFSTNNTGTWTNRTWTAFSGNPALINVTIVLNTRNTAVVSYRWFANDTSNNWGDSLIRNITVTSPGPSLGEGGIIIINPLSPLSSAPVPQLSSAPTLTPLQMDGIIVVVVAVVAIVGTAIIVHRKR